jgi:hypothetical protein
VLKGASTKRPGGAQKELQTGLAWRRSPACDKIKVMEYGSSLECSKELQPNVLEVLKKELQPSVKKWKCSKELQPQNNMSRNKRERSGYTHSAPCLSKNK